MNVNTNNLVSITEANQNFSRVARMVDESGAVAILKNNTPRYLLIECLCLVKKQNQNTSIDSSLPLFRSLKELAKICYNFQNSRTFDVAKPLYIMKGGLERYGFGRTI